MSRDRLIDVITIGFTRAAVKEANGANVDKAAEIADVLLGHDYRKSAEVAAEIFEDLSKFIVTKVIDNGKITYDVTDNYIEVKKKYLERENG